MTDTATTATQPPRWSTPRYQAATRKTAERAPDFHQKAAHVLRDAGFSGPATASILGISVRAVRGYLAEPCQALEDEREEIVWRSRVLHHAMTKQGRAPWDVWAFLRATKAPMVADLLGFDPWDEEDAGATSRERVEFFYLDGGWTQREIAGIVGISQAAVSKYVQDIKACLALMARLTAKRNRHSNP